MICTDVVQKSLAKQYPQSHAQNPFPVVIWNPFELPKPEPAFRSLKPGLVYVNFDPVLSGIERPVDDPVEYDQV